MHAIYAQITQTLIAAIEDGAGDYAMPWHQGGDIGRPTNAGTRSGYRGINTLLLWAAARQCGFSSGLWATYCQWQKLGGQVRKGERSTTVLLWKPAAELGDHDGREGAPPRRALARAFRVFAAEQVEGYEPVTTHELSEAERVSEAEIFFENVGAAIWHDGDRAFYDPRSDMIAMPSFSVFNSASAYYSVVAHEAVHWTGAKPRLDRDLSSRFGTEAYAFEELVAEIGAAFIASHLGLKCEARADHAPYIASWLELCSPRHNFSNREVAIM